MVLTGSMNWTYGGYSENDENTIIIHNDTIANLYLQAHAGNYEVISGGQHLTKQHGCRISAGVNNLDDKQDVDVYPNPYSNNVAVNYTLSGGEKITIEVYNMMGQKVLTVINGEIQNAGEHTCYFRCAAPGVYILRMQKGQEYINKKLIQIE
jgi:hypothetical protein